MKNVLEAALNEEMTEHLGHAKRQVSGGREGVNVRNGTRPKTVLAEATGKSRLRFPGIVKPIYTAPNPQAARRRSRSLPSGRGNDTGRSSGYGNQHGKNSSRS